MFESSVNSYDSQTGLDGETNVYSFESSVNSYDSQTVPFTSVTRSCLRVV